MRSRNGSAAMRTTLTTTMGLLCIRCRRHRICKGQRSPVACPCLSIPQGYTRYGSLGLYKMHNETKNWNMAKITCEIEGGYLAVLNSQAEADLVTYFLDTLKTLFEKPKPKDHYMHLGFFDVGGNGTFITVLDEPLTETGYTKWAPGQPDNYNGNERCGTFMLGHGLNDIRCDSEAPFLCELFV